MKVSLKEWHFWGRVQISNVREPKLFSCSIQYAIISNSNSIRLQDWWNILLWSVKVNALRGIEVLCWLQVKLGIKDRLLHSIVDLLLRWRLTEWWFVPYSQLCFLFTQWLILAFERVLVSYLDRWKARRSHVLEEATILTRSLFFISDHFK